MLPEVRHVGRFERPEHAAGGARSAARSRRCSSPRPRSTRRSCSAVRDYVEKNGFQHVVHRPLGRDRLDAGRAASRVDALGPERVHVRRDALALLLRGHAGRRPRAGRQPRRRDASSSRSRRRWRPTSRCSPTRFEGREPDITEENLQARIRGNLLMALSNKFGWLVLTTGNKSEVSVGYSTLYGDTAGGFAVIKDVPKTLVYRLVDHRNARDGERPVPQSIIDAPAERRAAARPARRRLAARLRRRWTRSSRPTSRRTPTASSSCSPASPRTRRPRDRARRPRRVQAPPGAAGDQDHAARVRARPADADHERVPAAARRLRVRTPPRDSLTARERDPHERRTGGPSSSVMSTSHTAVVRPL